MSKWEEQEGDPIQSNPLDTTKPEPGSYSWNSAGVQVYVNADGESADYWGIDGTDSTLLYPNEYPGILSTLRNPVNNPSQQCVNLSNAVGSSPWGTGYFSGLC